MSDMLQWVEDVTPLNRVFCSDGYDQAIEYFSHIIPFVVHEYSQGGHNGWEIHPHWDVEEAVILKDGQLIWDGTKHPLGVIALSAPFEGHISCAELKRHLHFDQRFPQAIPYHFRQMYRPWDRDWGFCVPRTLYDNLTSGFYDVRIRTREKAGVLRIPECTKPGSSDLTFVFVAHLDHPGMSNDDLCGCVVGVELMRRLLKMDTKYSYKLLLVQEIIGSEYYLSKMLAKEKKIIFESLFLEMLGSKTPLAIQKTRDGSSLLVDALEKSMTNLKLEYRTGSFRSIICNDESIWESYGHPMATLTRAPYPEYHSDLDNPSIISTKRLEESVAALLGAVAVIEQATIIVKDFLGTICLSNPNYDLYIETHQPAFSEHVPDDHFQKIRQLMDFIPCMDRPTTLERLSKEFNISEAVALKYLQKWRDKKLLRIF
ncbi:MAG: DUF4910 domain-containing protein [Desulfovibrionaceae bacterium]